jgi:protein-S-isoprenylcysteine O-methyltransferase Ste14
MSSPGKPGKRLPAWRIMKHAHREVDIPDPLMVRIGTFFFAHRNWVFTVALLAALAGFRPVLLFGSARADLWLDLVGFAVTAAGELLRIAVIGYAPIESGGRKGKVAAARLIRSGLLNHVRNPLYIGNVLVVGGLALVHNSPWVYALGLPFTLFGYSAIVAAEEAFLSRKFGQEYQDYRRSVSRWVPNVRGLRKSVDGVPFDWRRVMLQEYGSIYIAAGLPLAVMLYEGPHGETARSWVLAGLLALATIAWLCLRVLKLRVVARRREQQYAG